ncbi:MAG: mechanosensitive ion channel family protein [Chloroflexi bacterium]|nr:MAG: mechanosensitive ion channel family protein [Chloroflexota bacterium]
MESLNIDFTKAVSVLLIAIAAGVSGRLIGRLLLRYGQQLAARTRTASDDYIVLLCARAAEFGIYLIGVMMILSTLNVSITPLLTGAGVLGIFIGLAGREVFSNTLAGLFIIADRPFDVGQRVLLPKELGDIYGSWGDVVQIGLRSTRVRSTDGVLLTIPNSQLVNDVVVNFSHEESPHLRVRIRIGLEPYWDNVRRAMKTVEEIVTAHPDVISDPRPPEVVLREIRDYDVLLEVRFYVETARKMRRTKSQLIEGILKAFEEQSIQIAFPLSLVRLLPAGDSSQPQTSPESIATDHRQP